MSKTSTTYSLKLNTSYTKARFEPRYHAAQVFLDNEVLKDSAPYVPMDTGQLMRSGTNGTTPGSGEVVYNAPYAAPCYYGDGMQFQKTKHPLACARWFEVSKGQNKDQWVKGTEAVLKG